MITILITHRIDKLQVININISRKSSPLVFIDPLAIRHRLVWDPVGRMSHLVMR